MTIQSMQSCQNWLIDEKIRSFIVVSVTVETFNVGAKINKHSTRICDIMSVVTPIQTFIRIFQPTKKVHEFLNLLHEYNNKLGIK